MLASFPASMLNQKHSDLGIPNRFRLDPSRSSARSGLRRRGSDAPASTGYPRLICDDCQALASGFRTPLLLLPSGCGTLASCPTISRKRTARYRNELAQCDRDDRSAENAEMCAPALIFVSLGIACGKLRSSRNDRGNAGHHRGDSGVRLAVGPEGQGDCSIGKAILTSDGL